jgi:hypothetical protein
MLQRWYHKLNSFYFTTYSTKIKKAVIMRLNLLNFIKKKSILSSIQVLLRKFLLNILWQKFSNAFLQLMYGIK